jgi:hypothetical protein
MTAQYRIRPVPSELIACLGAIVSLSLLYAIARHTSLVNDDTLLPEQRPFYLTLEFDWLGAGAVVLVAIMSMAPTHILRKRSIASWILFLCSIVSSVPIFALAVQYWGKNMLWRSDDSLLWFPALSVVVYAILCFFALAIRAITIDQELVYRARHRRKRRHAPSSRVIRS